MDEKFFLRGGISGDAAFSLVVTPERAGWAYSGLLVLPLTSAAGPEGGT